jgi:hypothetical protein
MTAPRKPAPKQVPTFKSYEEEAEFWDKHSPLDYGFKTEKPSEAAGNLGHILAVRLDAKTIARLGQAGRAKGVGASTLARMWLLERLGEEDALKAQSGAKKGSKRSASTS